MVLEEDLAFFIRKRWKNSLNINKLLRSSLASDRGLLLMMDPLADEEESPTIFFSSFRL